MDKLKLAEKTALDIDRLRDGYRPAARRGAILFFVLSEMALVNSMYQYSLAAFLEVFGLSLKKSLPDSILMKRLKNIMDTLTFNIYNYGCTGEPGLGRPGQCDDTSPTDTCQGTVWTALREPWPRRGPRSRVLRAVWPWPLSAPSGDPAPRHPLLPAPAAPALPPSLWACAGRALHVNGAAGRAALGAAFLTEHGFRVCPRGSPHQDHLPVAACRPWVGCVPLLRWTFGLFLPLGS